MPTEPRRYRFSFQARVMAVVALVLVALPAITLTIIDGRLRRQLRLDADLVRSTAHGAFVQSLKFRSSELLVRFRTGNQDQRFLRIVRLNDAPTMREFLQRSVLEELRDDTELAVFVTNEGEVRGARREAAPVTPEEFAAAAGALVQAALHGEERTGSIALPGVAYQVVALPVAPPEGQAGAMLVGLRINGAMLRDLRPPGSELFVTAGAALLASTLPDTAVTVELRRRLVALGAGGAADEMLQVGADRHLPVAGALEGDASRSGLRYVLLTSTEQRLRSFEETRALLLGLSAAGILAGAGVIWFFVRRITRPLVELRDNAEAIGRGDFTRRIESLSNDECGELAAAFNRMTGNLQTSRAELERAMQQLRTTQSQLIQSEKLSAVGQFVAGVAHELNNPLTMVLGFADLLQGTWKDEKHREYVDILTKSAHRCHKVVQNLLSFARQRPPERRQVRLNTVVGEVLSLMSYDLRTNNITVETEFAADLPEVNADPHQLQQVFVNIVSNARQAMEKQPHAGRIRVRTLHEDGRVVVEFEDNGPGIKPENLARVFDPFFTTKPVGKGTGLGLSLCYGIVQEHGGTITVRSEPGHGATFRVTLPASDPSAPPATDTGSSAPYVPAQFASARRTVLVIDDEEWILELAAELLRVEGHDVDVARGGQEALELVERRDYDVIVSDWKMPGLNGVRLFEEIKTRQPALAERVLFMTGDVMSDGLQEFLRTHALACLAKPFSAREFNAAVARLLGVRPAPPVRRA